MCFGSTTSTQNNSNWKFGTTTNSYEPWARQAGQDLYTNAAGWANDNPWQGYSGPMSGEFGPEFGQASGFLSGQLGQTNPMTMEGADATRGVMGAINPNATIGDYMDPYVDATLRPTLQNIGEQAQRQGQQIGANAALAGAYGGTAHGVQGALNDRWTRDSIADATSKAYSAAFGNAQNARLQNLQQLLGAGQSMANIGQSSFGQGTTLASLLAGLGSQRQQADDTGIGRAIQLNSENQTQPMNRYGMLAQILHGVPLNTVQTEAGIGGGQTQTRQPNNAGMSFLGSLLTAPIFPAK